MALSAGEAGLIQSLWAKIAPQGSALGAETLERLFLVFPGSKNFFSHLDLSHGSTDLLNQGRKLFNALGNAVSHLDDLANTESTLGDLQAFLSMDPRNIELLSYTIHVVLAVHFPDDFTPEAQSAWDKFLSEFFAIMTSKNI